MILTYIYIYRFVVLLYVHSFVTYCPRPTLGIILEMKKLNSVTYFYFYFYFSTSDSEDEKGHFYMYEE